MGWHLKIDISWQPDITDGESIKSSNKEKRPFFDFFFCGPPSVEVDF